jgi:hypothetical protein
MTGVRRSGFDREPEPRVNESNLSGSPNGAVNWRIEPYSCRTLAAPTQ